MARSPLSSDEISIGGLPPNAPAQLGAFSRLNTQAWAPPELESSRRHLAERGRGRCQLKSRHPESRIKPCKRMTCVATLKV